MRGCSLARKMRAGARKPTECSETGASSAVEIVEPLGHRHVAGHVRLVSCRLVGCRLVRHRRLGQRLVGNRLRLDRQLGLVRRIGDGSSDGELRQIFRRPVPRGAVHDARGDRRDCGAALGLGTLDSHRLLAAVSSSSAATPGLALDDDRPVRILADDRRAFGLDVILELGHIGHLDDRVLDHVRRGRRAVRVAGNVDPRRPTTGRRPGLLAHGAVPVGAGDVDRGRYDEVVSEIGGLLSVGGAIGVGSGGGVDPGAGRLAPAAAAA